MKTRIIMIMLSLGLFLSLGLKAQTTSYLIKRETKPYAIMLDKGIAEEFTFENQLNVGFKNQIFFYPESENVHILIFSLNDGEFIKIRRNVKNEKCEISCSRDIPEGRARNELNGYYVFYRNVGKTVIVDYKDKNKKCRQYRIYMVQKKK